MLRPYYVGSFPRADVPLAPALPEVALIGRSNVGKSSLLNALAGQRIAKTSRTPGKTRMLNVYELPLVRGAPYAVAPAEGQPPDVHQPQPRTAHRALYLLDLPGYGYARAAQTERAAFRHLIRHVIERPRLAGVLWLLDIRREPSEDDRAMQDLFAARETPVLATLTKSDALAHVLELQDDQMIVTSAREKEGIAELREAIAGLVGTPPSDPGLAPGVSLPPSPY